MLKRTLAFNPLERITVEEILKHPYVKEFHNPAKETKCTKRVSADMRFKKMIDIRERIYMLAE